MGWEAGDIVVYRHVLNGRNGGRPWCVVPARVVEDSDERVVLWWPAGTRYHRPPAGDRIDALRDLAEGTWKTTEVEWWGGDSLQIVPRAAPFALWPFRLNQGDDLLGWYCNLQAPLTRTEQGFDTNDWTLDVWAAPDLSSWKWKDEHELEAGHQMGLYSSADVARIRAAGERVIALIEERSSLFDEWADWTAPAHWQVPEARRGLDGG